MGRCPMSDTTLHGDAMKLRIKLDHLDTLLLMSYGEPAETMNERMLPHVRDDYLAAVHALAGECKDLAETLEARTAPA